jgi:hypothetical protein
MGSGCACQSTIENDTSDRIRLHRQGNLTFYIHGDFYSERLVAGKGCKKTPAWQTTMSREEIEGKIKEFWDTRVEGSPMVWTILQQACAEPDPDKAEALLKTYGLTLNNGLLQQTYDERGYRYDLPPFVINPAVKYGEAKIVAKAPAKVKTETLELVFRAAGEDDCRLSLISDLSIERVKEKYKEKMKSQKEVRLFYNGKELKDQSLLGQSNVATGNIILVFVKN